MKLEKGAILAGNCEADPRVIPVFKLVLGREVKEVTSLPFQADEVPGEIEHIPKCLGLNSHLVITRQG